MQVYKMRTKDGEELYFSAPGDGGYVTLDGEQICEGGGFTGATLTCKIGDLPRVARKWRRQYLKARG